MSRTGVPGSIDEFGAQIRVLTTPTVGADDLDNINRRVQTAWLQAGVTLLEGITDALRQASDAVERGRPATPSAVKIQVD